MYIKVFLLLVGLFIFSIDGISQTFNTVREIKQLQSVKVIKRETVPEAAADPDGPVIPVRDSVFSKKKVFALPLNAMHVTSSYGFRIDPFSQKQKFHQGIDLRASNDSVFSIMPGVVSRIGEDKRLGNYIVIDHGIYSSIYGHLSGTLVVKHQLVKAGDLIAISGNTGKSTASHLHLGLKKNKKFINPLPYLRSINELLLSAK